MSESVRPNANDNVAQDESSYTSEAVEVPANLDDAGLQGPPSRETLETSVATATTMQKGMTLKGMLMMAVCCGVPFLLLAAVSLFGVSLAGTGNALLSVAALVACPAAMYVMMRMMMRNNSNK